MEHAIAFGPVPSRRLGRSIGINNIPAKVCSYSCVYCQLGRAIKMQAHRQSFFPSQDIVRAVTKKLEQAQAADQPVDYLTFVPDGEPTLDSQLAQTAQQLQPLGIPLAIITNSSLLGQPAVRDDLQHFDWVSVKVDAADEASWRTIDRPHKHLSFTNMVDGLHAFANQYTGQLVTETMLVEDYNTHDAGLQATAELIDQLHPHTAYLAIPTRPPAVSKILPASETSLAKAYGYFTQRQLPTEYLIGYEGNAFAFTGNAEEDILSITAVHPMRRDAVEELLQKDAATWQVVDRLIAQDQLIHVVFGNNDFYVRKLRDKQMG